MYFEMKQTNVQQTVSSKDPLKKLSRVSKTVDDPTIDEPPVYIAEVDSSIETNEGRINIVLHHCTVACVTRLLENQSETPTTSITTTFCQGVYVVMGQFITY